MTATKRIRCETRSAGRAVQSRYTTALEWVVDAMDFVSGLDLDGPRYITLTAGKLDSLEFRLDPAALDTGFDELEEMVAEMFSAALEQAESAAA